MTEQEPYQQGFLIVTDSVCASDRWWCRQSKQAHLKRIDDCVHSDTSNDILTMVRSFLTRIDNDLKSNNSQTRPESIFQSTCGLYSSIDTIDIDIVEAVKKYPPGKDTERYSLDTTPIYISTPVDFLTLKSLKPDVKRDIRTSLKETGLDQRSLLLNRAVCIRSRTCRNHAKCRLCAMDGLSNRRPSCPFFNS